MNEPKPKSKPHVTNIVVDSPSPVELTEEANAEVPTEVEPEEIVRVQPVKREQLRPKHTTPFPGPQEDGGMRALLERMYEVAQGGSVQQLRAQAVVNCPGDKESVRLYQEKMRRLRDAAEAAYQSALEQGNMVLLG
jgi:hypothetical protein